MPKRKSLKTIQAKIEKTKQSMADARRRYDNLAGELKTLSLEYEQVQATLIADAFKKSGKSFDELMVVLGR